MHVKPPLVPLIKGNDDDIRDKDCAKIILRMNPMSQKSDIYEFKMALFDNGKPQNLLLFIRNFKHDY